MRISPPADGNNKLAAEEYRCVQITETTAMTDLVGRALNQLGQQLRGRLSMPGDDGYDAATAIWAKPVGRVPRAVVHCRSAEDVQLAIRVARNCDLPVSVRGGGHDWAGRALCEGIVIDISAMNAVVINPDEATARVSGGARSADVAALADGFDLAAVTGSVGAVGMAGLALGGGYGPLIGRFGLVLDNLLGADVVLADGRLVSAEPGHEDELFWALRGGGGNFGVVTAMRFRLHSLPSVRSGLLVYPYAEAEAVLEGCADIAAMAPEALTAQLAFAVRPDGVPMVMVVPTWCGAPDEGECMLAPFARLGTLLANSVITTSYGDSLSVFDPFLANGQRVLMETCWVPRLDTRCNEALIQAMRRSVSTGCAIFTHEFKGAASRVPATATAFGLRRDHVLIEILATFADGPDEQEELRHWQWTRATLKAFDEVALPGGYPNLLAQDAIDRALLSYGDNAARLIRAKRHYDPENIFHSAIPLPVS
jgi:FAD/FMN-containing dehydrogenase